MYSTPMRSTINVVQDKENDLSRPPSSAARALTGTAGRRQALATVQSTPSRSTRSRAVQKKQKQSNASALGGDLANVLAQLQSESGNANAERAPLIDAVISTKGSSSEAWKALLDYDMRQWRKANEPPATKEKLLKGVADEPVTLPYISVAVSFAKLLDKEEKRRFYARVATSKGAELSAELYAARFSFEWSEGNFVEAQRLVEEATANGAKPRHFILGCQHNLHYHKEKLAEADAHKAAAAAPSNETTAPSNEEPASASVTVSTSTHEAVDEAPLTTAEPSNDNEGDAAAKAARQHSAAEVRRHRPLKKRMMSTHLLGRPARVSPTVADTDDVDTEEAGGGDELDGERRERGEEAEARDDEVPSAAHTQHTQHTQHTATAGGTNTYGGGTTTHTTSTHTHTHGTHTGSTTGSTATSASASTSSAASTRRQSVRAAATHANSSSSNGGSNPSANAGSSATSAATAPRSSTKHGAAQPSERDRERERDAGASHRRDAPAVSSSSRKSNGPIGFELPRDRAASPPPSSSSVAQRTADDCRSAAVSVPPNARALFTKLSGRTFTVNKHTYVELREIGKGGSSRVIEALSESMERFAVKRVQLAGADELTVKSYINEINILRELAKKPNIIRIIEAQSIGTELFIVMEMGEADLARLMRRAGKDGLGENYVRLYWQEMLQCVKVVHEARVVHSDLKPGNFVIVRGRLKLIDFGIAKAICNDTTNISRENQIGTLNYISPEALTFVTKDDGQVQQCIKLGRPADVWSLGCILYVMVYGRPPFQGSLPQKLAQIPNEKYAIPFPATPLGEPVIDVMRQCLQRQPHLRPTIEELLKHPFVRPSASSSDKKRGR